MKYHELNIEKAKAPKRVGRGIAADKVRPPAAGTKGQMSRTGSHKRPDLRAAKPTYATLAKIARLLLHTK